MEPTAEQLQALAELGAQLEAGTHTINADGQVVEG